MIANASSAFDRGKRISDQAEQSGRKESKLYKKIGELSMDVEFLKKAAVSLGSNCQLSMMIEADKNHPSVRRQCELLELSRSGHYRRGKAQPSARDIANERLQKRIDEIYRECPFCKRHKIAPLYAMNGS